MTTRRLVLIHQQPTRTTQTPTFDQHTVQTTKTHPCVPASTHQYLTHHTTQCGPTTVSVVHSGGETPGPIPNPEAKPARADGTAPGRRWESRLPPTQQLHTNTRHTPTQVRGGCFTIYPLHHRLADTTTPHRGHCRHLHTPQRGLLGVQGSSAPLRTTPVPPCGHRDSALQTPQVPTYFAMQTSRRESIRTCSGLRHRIADTAGTYTLRNADPFRGEEGIFVLLRTSSPHCGLLDCPGLRTFEVRNTANLNDCGLHQSALRTRQVPTHSAMQTRWQVGEAWTHCGHPADVRTRQHCGLCVSALQTMQVPSYPAMQVCCGCAVSMLLALRECVAT